jgi:dienelactone hydrolase
MLCKMLQPAKSSISVQDVVSAVAKSDIEHLVEIPSDGVIIKGIIRLPSKAQAVVIIAHTTIGHHDNLSSQYLADRLQEAGFGTLRVDLLGPVEAGYPQACFDIKLLTERLAAATWWLATKPRTRTLTLGYLTQETGTAAALRAAANLKPKIKAIVSCSGRPDLAFAALPHVDTPTLFIAAAEDHGVARINQRSANLLSGDVGVEILPGTKNLFEEPAIEEVARLACRWFSQHRKSAKTKIPRDE